MDSADIEQAMEAARRQVQSGKGLQGTGFWKAVAAVRADRTLAARWASEIGSIDRMAFENGVRLRVPAPVGTTVLSLGTVAAIVMLCLAKRVEGQGLRTLFFFGAFGVLLLTTHSLAHWLVGRMFGMRFTHYFLGGPSPPRPGAKLDYASYLGTSPRRRALMHASGAVVTKILPFAFIPVAVALGLPGWSMALLAVTGVVQIITDILFSTKTSDWKKVKRELRAARRAPEGGPAQP
jgi:hypothetical protein